MRVPCVVLSVAVCALLSSCMEDGEVSDTYPAAGSTAVPPDARIVVELSARVNPDTVSEETFVVSGTLSGRKKGNFSIERNQVTFTPEESFRPGEVVTVTLTDQIRLLSGAYIEPFTFTFTVAGGPAGEVTFELIETHPGPNEAGFARTGEVRACFSTPPLPYTVTEETVRLFAGRAGMVPVSVRVDPLSVTCLVVDPAGELPPGETFWCVFSNRIAGAGGALEGFALSFTAAAVPWAGAPVSIPLGVKPSLGPVVWFPLGETTGPPFLLIPVAGGIEVWKGGRSAQRVAELTLPGETLDVAVFDRGGRSQPIVCTDTGSLVLLSESPSDLRIEGVYDFPGCGSLSVCDLDCDGSSELLVGDAEGIGVWRYREEGSWEKVQALPAASQVADLNTADLNSDGRVDLYWLSGSEGAVTYALSQKSGVLAAPVELPVTARSAWAGDVTGDSFPELVLATQRGLVVLQNRQGAFPSEEVVREGEVTDLAGAPVDGDAIPDLLVLQGAAVTVFHPRSSGGYEQGVTMSVPSGMRGLLTCDFTSDGTVDVLLWGESVLALCPEGAAPEGGFSVSLTDCRAEQGSQVTLQALLSNTEPVEGFTLCLRYPVRQVDLLAVEPDGVAATAEFVIPEIDDSAGEAALGVILEMLPPFVLPEIPPGADQVIAAALLQISAEAPEGTYTLACDQAPSLGHRTSVVVAGESIYPEARGATLTIGSAGGGVFLRGDVDASGAVNGDDHTMLLRYLLGPGAPPRCFKAADINDDGRLSIEDAYYLQNFLYTEGPPPAPPFPEAGLDPTADALPCDL